MNRVEWKAFSMVGEATRGVIVRGALAGRACSWGWRAQNKGNRVNAFTIARSALAEDKCKKGVVIERSDGFTDGEE